MASSDPLTGVQEKSFFQKYIAPNVFNFYPAASAIGLIYFAAKNGWSYDGTMSNGGDWLVFFLCVKLCMIHNGLAHLFMTKIIHKSQGLTPTPGSLMFENELGAVCLSMGIFAILVGGGEAVAAMAKTIGGFFSYAAARHVAEGQPIGTASGGILTAVLLFMAGFHASPLDFSHVL
mmetsp:Transcript_10323/g.18389  ORF Transcript_10323/g.18389 Transcript_10323/m.18389 type:complete len:176 (-) Transcript_10323:191-718(-)|eukprot:CAMPEP_0197662680 /NCGR_PEP_ID=MMETSP1338-20131121/54329_1 /TAXON_ID=43686 ORGANISM="Pelagodinium beii, Strain RCC1491" /NCGR_SAMPLE_ID=MMETSP1338 /ASSEMBLY_ACC=CAM_ASM_000754 /LENGTH=175 /DNA_ID=CAMNT_0043240625 /DNA_START=68 /DNA_END=595 /DNA_ORIENTATION=+